MFQRTIPLPTQPGDSRQWGNLCKTRSALAISCTALEDNQPLMIITPDSASANRLEDELGFFLSDQAKIHVKQMPDWEILPYDTFSPHQDIISQRLSILYHLPFVDESEHKTVIIVPITTLLHRLCPQYYLMGSCLSLKVGAQFCVNERRQQLEQSGYRCVESVMEHGEFAIRGSIVDIYPMGSDAPYRIDLFDDEIDSLRTFDPETQRSVTQVSEISLLPGHEFPMDNQGIELFRANYREAFDVNYRECPMYQDVSQGIASPGIEYYLPLFFKETATLFDYLPNSTRILVYETVHSCLDHFYSDVTARYESRRVDPQRPILHPSTLLISTEEFYRRLKSFPSVTLYEKSVESKMGRFNLPLEELPDLTINSKAEDPLTKFKELISQIQHVLVVAESAGRREMLLELFCQHDVEIDLLCGSWTEFLEKQPSLAVCTGSLENGFYLPQEQVAVIPEALLLGHRVQQRRRRKVDNEQNTDQVIRNLTELRVGAPVVHINHGVGRYHGLETFTVDNQLNEFLTLEYANEAKLYVPVSSLHLISRYTGADDELAPLHRLGNEQWSKVRRKAEEKARDVAVELLDIYSRREAKKGFSFNAPDQRYWTFASAFPFEETADQQQTIETVIRDMCAPKPMDLLVCGDVGFGKTEVAMRAAFLAVQNDKQVAILVPTTLLAQQHYDSFRDRFADWPVEIDVMSRFKSQKSIDQMKTGLSDGKIDIIIGTHKILHGDLKFKDLGLLIIDEEHRFGVRHKEKLKSYRSEVDVLTLTATPIPRTLNMAMSGIRDLAIIATPPARRLSVKTFVRQYDQPLVKEAILRELLRGGQVYYLHNQVNTIEKTASDLQTLIPEARIITGHGQMRERQLEQVMSDFYHKRYNVLVCTTIIETGIDIPNANTIIIDRADKFGLAQLHQLRGRVGRSHHQAYAYLLTPPQKSMTADAEKRLEAISEAQTLGAGFMLASNDLEIRGAGELLGDDQSGQIQSVGFSLYTEMLERAVTTIRNGETPNPDQPFDYGTEVNLNLPALLPENYISDVHNRLVLYKRIAAADSEEHLKDIQVELIDRFGLLPASAKNLFRQMKLKLHAHKLGINELDASSKEVVLKFKKKPNVDPMVIIQLIKSSPNQFKMEGSSQLRYIDTMETPEQRLTATETLLIKLAG